ncbi:MAG: substrate-binding domain-containing protein [Verrucomicrobiota bacterium]
MPSSKNRRSPAKTIAVFMSWHEPRILKGIARFAREKNWVILFDNAQSKGWSAIPKKVDGLLCLIGPDRAAARYLLNMKLPMVALSNSDEGLLGEQLRILLDDTACGRMAAEHLLSLGFENFLTIGKKNRTFFRDRILGFTETIGQRAKVIEQAWIGESLAQKSLRGPIEAAIRKLPKPLAIFSPSDVTCVHVMQCALELGLKVPEDIAILSTNNDELICDFSPVPLSSIRLNFTQMGFEAAALLDKVMRGKGPKKNIPPISPVGVVSRQSTQIMLVPDEQVGKALRYIRDHLSRPLPIEEISEHVGVSHATLGRLFRKHLRRSIKDEISSGRLEKAREMLSIGNLPIHKVAAACGFSTPNYFNHVFQRAHGVTPRKFRLAAKKAHDE